MKNEQLWKPTLKRIKSTSLFKFIEHINSQKNTKINDFETLHKWSVENRNCFWNEVWNFFNVIGHKGEEPYLEPLNELPGTRFFPNGKLNYAENMLKKGDSDIAITFFFFVKIKRRLN